MNERNFSVQSSLEANYLNIALENPVELDYTAIKVIKEDCPDFLLPLRMVDVNNQITFRYRLTNMTALAYCSMHFKKKEFLRFYMALIAPFIEGRDWFLKEHYLCINPKYVYVNKDFSKLYYIYIPENSYRNSDEEIIAFLRGVLDNITMMDDSGFLVQLYQYFNKGQVTLGNLYALLQKEEQSAAAAQSVSMSGLRQSAPDDPQPASGFWQSAPGVGRTDGAGSRTLPEAAAMEWQKKGPILQRAVKGAEEKKENVKQIENNIGNETPASDDELMALLFGEKGKKKGKERAKKEKPVKEKSVKERPEKGGFGLFGKKKEKKQSHIEGAKIAGYEQPMPQSIPEPMQQPFGCASGAAAPQSLELSDYTEIAEDDSCQNAAGRLELIASFQPGAPQQIRLDFTGTHITVGRASSDTTQPDIPFSSEFRRIGRMHIRIERNNDLLYVIDLGSANHTSLDGQILIPNTPYLLKAGAELVFTPKYPVRYRVIL